MKIWLNLNCDGKIVSEIDILCPRSHQTHCLCRADSRFAPSQWETALLCNDVSQWLGVNLESALLLWHCITISPASCKHLCFREWLPTLNQCLLCPMKSVCRADLNDMKSRWGYRYYLLKYHKIVLEIKKNIQRILSATSQHRAHSELKIGPDDLNVIFNCDDTWYNHGMETLSPWNYGHMGGTWLRTNFTAENRVVTWSCRDISKGMYYVAYNLMGVWRNTFLTAGLPRLFCLICCTHRIAVHSMWPLLLKRYW